MKKQFLNRVHDIYLHKRLPENLVPWKVLKKSTKQTQRTNKTKKAVGLPLLLKKGARGIHQKKVALKFAPSLKIDVLERGSLVSAPCSLKVWGNNVNRLSPSLKREKKGTTISTSPPLSNEALTPSGADRCRSLPILCSSFAHLRGGMIGNDGQKMGTRSAIPFDSTNQRLDARYQILSNHFKAISNCTIGRASLVASLGEAETKRGLPKQLLGIEGLVSNKSKPLSSFCPSLPIFCPSVPITAHQCPSKMGKRWAKDGQKMGTDGQKMGYKWRKGASLYSCFQLEGGLSKQQEKRSSPFLLQLLERKKLRILYGNLSNREINAVIKQARINRGGLGDNIFRLLESRLDVVLCRIGFFTTISFARQWVYHGKVRVNSKVLTIANYNLQPGDVISISPSHCQFLKPQIDALLGRHMVERAATSIIDHHNLSKARTPEGQGGTKNLRSLAISFSKTWLGWENNRSSPLNPLSRSSPAVENSTTRFKGHPFAMPWPAEKSPLRTPLNLANIMESSMIGSDMARANNQVSDLGVARNNFPVVTWQNLVDDPPIDSRINPTNGSSLTINEVDHGSSMDQSEKLRFFLLKLTHVEVSLRLFTAVYLYSPQRILLPATIDIEKIRKSRTA